MWQNGWLNGTKSAFYLPKLAGSKGQSVNQMRQFERIVLHNHFETGTRCFEEIQRTGIKRILQIGTFRLRTNQSTGEFW